MRRTIALLSLALFALPACSKSSEEKAETSKEKTEAAEKSTEKKDEAAEEKIEPIKPKKLLPRKTNSAQKDFKKAADQPDQGKKLAQEFRVHLSAGRKLVRAKKYDKGIKEFEKALEIDPNDPRALSELGWASFLSNDLERAERANEASVKYAANDKIKGASLYNLGRVSEARGDLALARGYYEQSLSIRPNKIVQKRLDALLVKDAPAAKSAEGGCEFDAVEGVGTAEELVAKRSTLDESFLGQKPGVDEKLSIDGDQLTSAAIVSTFMKDMDMERFVGVALKVNGVWYYRELEVEYNPGAFGIMEEVVASVEVKDLIPGGGPEILVTTRKDRSDSDMGIDEFENSVMETVLVISIVDGKPKMMMEIAQTNSYQRDRLGFLEDTEIDSSYATKNLPIKDESGAEVVFDGKGNVTVTQKPSVTPSYKPGTFVIADFPQRCM